MAISRMTLRNSGIVVAVPSNVAHADTSAISLELGVAFAKQAR